MKLFRPRNKCYPPEESLGCWFLGCQVFTPVLFEGPEIGVSRWCFHSFGDIGVLGLQKHIQGHQIHKEITKQKDLLAASHELQALRLFFIELQTSPEQMCLPLTRCPGAVWGYPLLGGSSQDL